MKNGTGSTPMNAFNVSTENNCLRIYMPPTAEYNHYSKVLREIGRVLCNLENPSEVVIHVTNTTSDAILLSTTLSQLSNEINAGEDRVRKNDRRQTFGIEAVV